MPDPTRTDVVRIEALRWAVLIAAALLATFWSRTFGGLYALLARLQFAAIGAYISGLTWLVVFTAIAIPLHLAARAVARRAGLTAFDAVPLRLPPLPRPVAQFLGRHLLSLFGALWIAGGVAAGGYFLIDGLLAGPLTPQSVEALYAGEQPRSRYVDLAGRPLRSADYVVGLGGSTLTRSGAGPDYYYFPAVPAAWRPGDPVHVVVQSFSAEDHPDGLRGILRRRVPPLAREALARSVTVADAAWLLDETTTPDDDRQLGLTLMGVFSLFGFLMIGVVHALVRSGDHGRV